MIRNLLTFGRSEAPAVEPATSAPAAGPKTILIIDDHAESLRTMCLALGGAAYRVETADTSRSALRKVSGCHPDLILLDTRLPAADGTRLAHRLLADEELASIPMVALMETVTGAEGIREAGDRNGGGPNAGGPHAGGPYAGGPYDAYIQKPIDVGTFAARVRGLFPSSMQEAPRSAVDPAVPDGAAPNRRMDVGTLLDAIEKGLPDSQFAPDTQTGLLRLAGVAGGSRRPELAGYLQRAERLSNASTVRARSRFRLIIRLCRELVDLDPDAAPELAELRAGYLDRRRAELGDLKHAVHVGDFAAIRKAGHNLKGTGAAYGFAEITEIGRSLEAAAKDGDAGATETLLDQLDSYIGVVQPSTSTGEIDAAGI